MAMARSRMVVSRGEMRRTGDVGPTPSKNKFALIADSFSLFVSSWCQKGEKVRL